MPSSRRKFMHRVGVALASALTLRCRSPVVSCYEPMPITSTPSTPSLPSSNPAWIALRDCWLALDSEELRSFEETDASRELRQKHAAALDALVADGELTSAVADEIAVAFEEALAHIKRQMATCYIAIPPEFTPRADLVQQAAILEELAVESEIDPETVRRAQEALARDITWLTQFHAGQTPGELDGIQATPEATEAARILVELLLGGTE